MKVNFDIDFTTNKNLKFYVSNYKIGLDVDECLADFLGKYKETFGHCDVNSWYFSYSTMEKLEELKDNEDWWLSLKPLIKPSDLPFMPHCYISKRNFSESVTQKWLEKHGFPCVPVYHVADSKVEVCKEKGIDYFCDDSILNFQRLNAAGIKTFLVDSIHNRQYDVGDYRIKNYQELIDKI